MLTALNSLCSKYVSLIVLLGVITGLSFELFGKITDFSLSVILFIELFIACFKINPVDFVSIRVIPSLAFVICRYIILSCMLFYLGSLFSATWALALLLLTLLPAGVSSPGFAGIFEANVALAISFTLVSSALSPFYLPFALEFLAGANVKIDSTQMLLVVFLLVVVPTVLHVPFRRLKVLTRFMQDQNALLLMPLVWVTIAIPVSRFRDLIISNMKQSLLLIIAFVGLYCFYVFFAYMFARKQNWKNIKTFAISSCVHNVTLGVVLSFLYLPESVSVLIVFANIGLSIVIGLLKGVLNNNRFSTRAFK